MKNGVGLGRRSSLALVNLSHLPTRLTSVYKTYTLPLIWALSTWKEKNISRLSMENLLKTDALLLELSVLSPVESLQKLLLFLALPKLPSNTLLLWGTLGGLLGNNCRRKKKKSNKLKLWGLLKNGKLLNKEKNLLFSVLGELEVKDKWIDEGKWDSFFGIVLKEFYSWKGIIGL